MKKRVVITGMGALSPIGNGMNEIWENAKKGKCGIGYITQFDSSNQKVHIAGELKNFNVDDYIDKRESRRMDRFAQLALIAAKEAAKMSGIEKPEEDTCRWGVNISSGIGGLTTIASEHSRGLERGFDRVSPFFIPMSIVNMASGLVAIDLGIKGSCMCTVTACASSTNSIGEGFRQIRDGYADVMVCGGSEGCINPLGIGGFTAMKALSESEDPLRASIPFDKERSGFVMGEGAAVLILEELEHAQKRGAVIIGEIAGYGTTCDAYHITAPLADGEGAARCMTMALEDAGISPEDVGYINAHGTSTPMNDKCETMAIKTVFSEHARKLAVSSTKSMTGHMLGGSGAMEAVLTIMALKDGFLPPTIGYRTFDPECDLDIIPNAGRKAEVKYALSNSLGFGGHNATLIFKSYK